MKQKGTSFGLVITGLVVIWAAAPARAVERRSSPLKPNRQIEVTSKRVYVEPYLTGGLLVGSMAREFIQDRGRRALYGFGLRADYGVRPYLRLGLSGELLFAKVNTGDLSRGRALLGAASAMFLLHPSRPGTFFGRAQLGLVNVQATHFTDGNLGTYPYFRLGAGNQLFSTPRVATRAEIFYEAALSKGSTTPFIFPGGIPDNAQSVGLEFGVVLRL